MRGRNDHDLSTSALLGSTDESSTSTSTTFPPSSSSSHTAATRLFSFIVHRCKRMPLVSCRPRRSLLLVIFMTSLISLATIWYVFPQLASLTDVKCYFRLNDQAEWVLDNTPPVETVRVLWFPETGTAPSWFQFRHLLSLYSVHHFLRPMRIYLHHSSLPLQAPAPSHLYFHEWLPQAIDAIPNLEFIHEKHLSGASSLETLVTTIAAKYGASIIIQPNIVFTRDIKATLSQQQQSESQPQSQPQPQPPSSQFDCAIWDNYQLTVVRNRSSIRRQCVRMFSNPGEGQGQGQGPSQGQGHGQGQGQGDEQGQLLLATMLMGYVVNSDVQPESYLVENSTFADLVRQLYYDASEPAVASRHSVSVVPATAHFVWFGRLELSFLQMVTVRSVLSVGGASTAYIHGDTPPEGVYWQELKDTFKDRVLHHPVARPQTVYQVELTTCFQQSDTVRLEILRLFGGFYIDFDVIITRPLQELFHYDAVIGPDWWGREREGYPLLNTAILMSKPNSAFIHHLLVSYRHFSNTKWNYNCCILPRNVFQRHPQSVRVEANLAYQVWFNSLRHDLTDPRPSDEWRQYYAYHFMRPEPSGILRVPITRQFVDHADTKFGQIARLALYGSTELRSS